MCWFGRWFQVLGAVLGALAMIATARADTVTLTAPGGGLSLSGELLAFDGRFYRIATEFGQMTVAGERVVCTGAACPGDGETTGFTVIAPPDLSRAVMPALIHLFAAEQGLRTQQVASDDDGLLFDLRRPGKDRHFPVHVRHGAAGVAYDGLSAGQADLVIATRPASPGERAALRAAGLGDPLDARQALILAHDALVLAEPFPGRGGPLAISDLRRRLQHDDGTPIYMRRGAADIDRLLGRSGATLPENSVLADSAHALAAALQARGGGLGVTLRSQLDGLRARPLVGACGLQLDARPAAILTGAYPLDLPVLAVVPARRLPRDMIPFIAFLQSDRAAAVLRRSGYLRASLQPVAMPDLGLRFLAGLARVDGAEDALNYARLARVMQGAERLSLAFPTGPRPEAALVQTTTLDLLANGISRDALRGRRVLLIGFDDRGIDRADASARELRDRLAARFSDGLPRDTRVEVLSAGDALPVTCPDGPWAAELNRRVEIWVRD